jgi:hypothetical protein
VVSLLPAAGNGGCGSGRDPLAMMSLMAAQEFGT